MNSECLILLVGLDGDEAWRSARAAETEVRRIEARYSRFLPSSDLTRINAVAEVGGYIVIDEETAGLISFAQRCHSLSAGAFDITAGVLRRAWNFSKSELPSQDQIETLLPRVGLEKVSLNQGRLSFARSGMDLDFGGLAKEYAADRAAEVCLALGATSGFVNLAGDVRIIGPQPQGEAWRIGVKAPVDSATSASAISLTQGGLATSGDYERFIEVHGRRYGHILDPRTGWPVVGARSVTVVSDRCLAAGALSTAAMAFGPIAADWLSSLKVAWLIIDEQGRIQHSENWARPWC